MSVPGNSAPSLRIPPWLRVKLPCSHTYGATRSLVDDLRLNTVCQSAKCPNMFECYSSGTATFLILGNVCTRNCAFCNITPGHVAPPDPDEPRRVAEAAVRLGLSHVVVTSVTRDDLPDGGAAHFAATVRALREALPAVRPAADATAAPAPEASAGKAAADAAATPIAEQDAQRKAGPKTAPESVPDATPQPVTIEVLIPDFQGSEAALAAVLDAAPDIINHNVETPPAHYPRIRPQADYAQSLQLLARVRAAGSVAKSGLMVGLGETDDEVHATLADLANAGCHIATIGQYMRPSRNHPPVERYVHPDTFAEYAAHGHACGIPHVFSAPLVRSSYNARAAYDALQQLRGM